MPDASIVPMAGLSIAHVPPETALLSVVVRPSHTVYAPVIVAGSGLTVTDLETLQPVPVVYTTVADPAAMPVMVPVTDDTDMTEGVVVDHVPPVTVLKSMFEVPIQMSDVPVIAGGNAVTVMVVDILHPLSRPYVTVTVPGVMPVNTPVVVLILPTAGLLALHVPPAVLLVRVTE